MWKNENKQKEAGNIFKYFLKVITQVISGRIQIGPDIMKRLQDVDGLFKSHARVQDVVLAVVGAQQLVHHRCPNGTDQIDQLQDEMKFWSPKMTLECIVMWENQLRIWLVGL